MKMRDDEVFDGFSRDLLFHRFDDSDGPFLEKRRFDHDYMILHFNSHAVMIAAFDVIDALRYLDQFDLLFTAEIEIIHTHDESAHRPLRNDALTHFRLGTNFGRNG